MELADSVDDQETLYRSVRPMHFEEHGGRYVTTPEAFSDRSQKISFDRSSLRVPDESRMAKDQAVFSINVSEVRAIEGAYILSTVHCVEVFASPLTENPSHAHVAASDSELKEMMLPDTAFRRLKKRLSEKATLVLPPL